MTAVTTTTTRPSGAAEAPSAARSAAPSLFGQALAAAAALPQEDLYGPLGARVYDAVAARDTAEVALVARLARRARARGPVVDLAAGSGRFTLALAARASSVLAVDTAPAMLGLLADRLAAAPDAIARRVVLRRDDATTTDLPDGTALVVLGATSISLLPAVGRARLLASVAAALAPDGRLLVSAHVAAPTADEEAVELLALPQDGLLATFVERVDVAAARREVLVLPSVVDGRPVAPVALRSIVGVVAAGTVEREALAAGLAVLGRHPLPAAGASGDAVVLELGRAVA
ncbi:daptide-type RiPP biosynthesis methyltransferase [Patulibacter sp. NPDC049589]|uniref:daptide-type RiPP biosynthesis methyltransferase n=1 Tax=Patulibacter sp. NPDC049589 TaxID=3154731 RepID=UPI00342E0272